MAKSLSGKASRSAVLKTAMAPMVTDTLHTMTLQPTGGLPLLAWPWPEVPSEWADLEPDGQTGGLTVLVFHPPMAGLVKTMGSATLRQMIGANLEAAIQATGGRKVELDFSVVSAPSGETVVFVYER